jgi:PAS domain S-box-containing protein
VNPSAYAADVLEQGEPLLALDQSWRIVLTNHRFEKLAGIPRDQLIGQVVWEIFPESAGPDDRFKHICERVLRDGSPTFFERYYAPWQKWLNVSVYPAGEGVALSFRVVTAKKQAEHAPGELTASLDRLKETGADTVQPLPTAAALDRAVLENALDAVVGMDAKGCIIDWNAHAEMIFGWPRHEVLGQSLSDLIIPEHQREAHQRGLERYLASGQGPILNQRIEVTALRRSGEEFPVELTVTPLAAQGDHLFYSFIRDISEQKQIQREREALVQRLEHDLSLGETFFSMLGHDLRTPLSAILMSAQLLCRRSREPSTRSAGGQIVTSAERMGRMIEQLLDLSRARLGGGIPIERRKMDLARVCREVVKEIESANSGSIIRSEVFGNCIGEWDPDRLAQVLTNLVDNAVHHSESGESVHVVLNGTDPNRVELTISNPGVIPPEALPVLFRPFERASRGNRGRRGLGLGLYITHEIVRGHAGTIEVRSKETAGTSFVVRLPRHDAAR